MTLDEILMYRPRYYSELEKLNNGINELAEQFSAVVAKFANAKDDEPPLEKAAPPGDLGALLLAQNSMLRKRIARCDAVQPELDSIVAQLAALHLQYDAVRAAQPAFTKWLRG